MKTRTPFKPQTKTLTALHSDMLAIEDVDKSLNSTIPFDASFSQGVVSEESVYVIRTVGTTSEDAGEMNAPQLEAVASENDERDNNASELETVESDKNEHEEADRPTTSTELVKKYLCTLCGKRFSTRRCSFAYSPAT